MPTWNYEIVQVRGVPSIIEDSEWLISQVRELTNAMESKRQEPWKVSDAPAEYIDGMIKAIVGLRIEITQILGKWKMSQNKSSEEIKGVCKGLSDPSDPHANPQVASIMAAKCRSEI